MRKLFLRACAFFLGNPVQRFIVEIWSLPRHAFHVNTV